jgi:hypothetical protein
MFIKEIIENKEIRVAIPLTATSGKIRIKRRSILNEYGIPVATCQTELTQNCYIEWQIGYDVVTAEKDKYEMITEIIIKEKKAVGVMPMLYLCFPITELKTEPILLGRNAKSKEEAEFIINKDNAEIFVQLLKLFGMLSENHRKDILSIIDVILKKV